jgi:excisionase family DNA binding protein
LKRLGLGEPEFVFPGNGIFLPTGQAGKLEHKMHDNLSPFFTAREAAEVLRIQPRTLAHWQKLGRVTPLRISGRGIRFKREEVLALVSSDPRQRPALFGRADGQQ